MLDTIDGLYAKEEHDPTMMSPGVHLTDIGRPARIGRRHRFIPIVERHERAPRTATADHRPARNPPAEP